MSTNPYMVKHLEVQPFPGTTVALHSPDATNPKSIVLSEGKETQEHKCCDSVYMMFWRGQVIEMENRDWLWLGDQLRRRQQHPSSALAWRVPWTEEPGGLQSMGSHSQTRLSGFTFTFHFHALEEEMATHSSALAWRLPGTGEPGGLPSMGSHRVGHD